MEEESIQEFSLRDALAVLYRRWWVIAGALVIGAAVAMFVTLLMRPVWEAESQIAIKTPPEDNNLTQALQIQPDIFKRTQVMLLQDHWVMATVSKNLRKRYGIRVGPLTLSRLVNIKDEANTELVDIAARYYDPVTAQRIADEIVYSFREYRQGVDREAMQGALTTMRDRVSQAREAMEKSSFDLANFKTNHHIVDLAKQTEAGITELTTIQLAQAQARQNLQGALGATAALQHQLDRQNRMLATSGERSNSLVEELRDHLTRQQQKLLQIQQTYVNFPAMADPIRADIEDTQRRLQAELSKARAGAGSLGLQEKLLADLQTAQQQAAAMQAQNALLDQQYRDAELSTRDLPSIAREFDQLSQLASVNQDLYQKALESFLTIDMEKLSQPSVIEITGLAELPRLAVAPRPLLNLAIGLFLGLILGLASCLIIEHLDETVHTEQDLRKLAPELPVLGVLPCIPSGEISNEAGGLSVATRGPYRLLWTNLGFAGIDEPIRSLVVTSALQGEGKSLTCAYVARAAAEEGKRVILVDCDLRRPSQHRNFGADNPVGLCEVISGKVAMRDALIPSDQPNLWLLPAGRTLPLNPAVLIKSERMGQIMEELLSAADVVIYDAPPSVAISDALLLAGRCQAVMQVVEAGRTRKDHIRKVIETLSRARSRHIGLVLNKVQKNGFGAYGYYYNYYYHNQDQNGAQNGHKTQRKRAPAPH